MNNTALGAGANKAQNNIIFISDAHEKFYYEKLKEVRYQDVYHKALCYCLGISDDTRRNIKRIYDFKTGCVKTECLHEGWQTSGSVKVVRMAFNLYCNGTPSVSDYEDMEEQIDECRNYTVEELFCCAYAPYFWQKNVRLIAVNENVDSFREDDDFTPFRNIMNEWYARDTSKKIKSTFKAKGKSGKHVASTTPYGYLKDPENPDHWIVDEEAAKIVQRIFHMTMDGRGPYQIARILKEEQVEIPAVHMAKKDAGLWKGRVDEIKDPYGWGSSTVAGILKKREYLGHTVNFKTRKHFKDKKSHYVGEDQWTVFEDTQEPIIDQETFDNVQRIRNNVRRYPDGWGEAHPLTGLMYCADCGAKMYVHRVNNGKRVPQYTCSAYSKIPVGTLCPTQHRINADVVMELIKELLKAIAEYSQLNREEFIETVRKAQTSQQSSEITRLKSRLLEAQKRVQDLEKLLCRIYEDNILGKLPDERYAVLDGQYSKEQKELSAEIAEMEAELSGYEEGRRSAEKFIAMVDKYQNFEELTTYMLNEFVEKIVVHERDRKGSVETTQEVEIYFNFIGRYLPPHLY